MRITSHQLALMGGVMLTLGTVWVAAETMTIAGIRTTPQSRTAYLARATIWQEPGVLAPNDLIEGPSDAFPYTFEQANDDEGIGCTFTQAGKELGGNSSKFLCRTGDGDDLRLKYWDPAVSHWQPRSVRGRRGLAFDVGAGIRSGARASDQCALRRMSRESHAGFGHAAHPALCRDVSSAPADADSFWRQRRSGLVVAGARHRDPIASTGP